MFVPWSVVINDPSVACFPIPYFPRFQFWHLSGSSLVLLLFFVSFKFTFCLSSPVSGVQRCLPSTANHDRCDFPFRALHGAASVSECVRINPTQIKLFLALLVSFLHDDTRITLQSFSYLRLCLSHSSTLLLFTNTSFTEQWLACDLKGIIYANEINISKVTEFKCSTVCNKIKNKTERFGWKPSALIHTPLIN